MLVITMKSERIVHWTKMRRSRALFSGPESLIHTRSLADFITTTFAFRFSVHTPVREDARMEMHQVRYFLAVARTLNFTRAADECNVAQPSLTRASKLLQG